MRAPRPEYRRPHLSQVEDDKRICSPRLSCSEIPSTDAKKTGLDIDTTGLGTDDVYQVWNRVHHALLQNNVGYMLYALGLEGAEDGWAIVRSTLSEVLKTDDSLIGREMYRYFTKETMPFKSFLGMRMGASFKV